MRSLCCTALFLALTGLAIADEKIDPAKLVGKWEASSPGKGDIATLEFTKDGTVKLMKATGSKGLPVQGTYKVEGNKLTMKINPGGNKKKTMDIVVTIDKLTDDEFVHTDDAKASKTFEKVTPDPVKKDPSKP